MNIGNAKMLRTAIRAVALAFSLGFAASAHAADAGVVIVESGGSTNVSESGARDSYTLTLTSPPTGSVRIAVGNADGQLTVSPAWVTFTAANYDHPQTITVGAVDDPVPEGPSSSTIQHRVITTDEPYLSVVVRDVTVYVADNDINTVLVTESGGSTQVTEGGAQDGYTLALTGQPSANVTVTVTTDRQRAGLAPQVTVSPAQVIFTPDNYATPQTVTVTAVDDTVAEAPATNGCATPQDACETLRHDVSSSDGTYNRLSVRNVTVFITDNDLPGVDLSESDGSTRVTEGGTTDSYTLVLTSQPKAPVTVALNPDPQLSVIPSSVTFSANNYATPQTITVSAIHDQVAQGPHAATISHSVNSTDQKYQNAPVRDVTVTITDIDVPAVLVSESGGGTQVTEGGTPHSYTLALSKRPTANVFVDLRHDDQVAVQERVTFTAANFATPQTVTVTAVDDLVVEDTKLSTITHHVSSADPAYAGLAVDDVTATVFDNDKRGVTLNESGGSTEVAEGGGPDSYAIVLTAQPLANVTITIHADPQLSVEPASVTFTPDNFATPQPISVSAVDDQVAQGSRLATITHSVSSGDGAYDAIGVRDLTVSIIDNDSPAGSAAVSSGHAGSLSWLTLAWVGALAGLRCAFRRRRTID